MPSQKFAKPEDIGELVVFLSSKYADNITGSSQNYGFLLLVNEFTWLLEFMVCSEGEQTHE